MSDIFQKTTLGYDEIVNRVNGLSPRLRRCLILIDGQRSLIELMGLLRGEDISPLIQTLEIEGYIELIGTTMSPPSTGRFGSNRFSLKTYFTINKPPDSEPDLNINAGGFIDRKGQVRRPLQFSERKARASRALNELLGPLAEGIALKIEFSENEVELNSAMTMACMLIADAVDLVASNRFKDHVRLVDAP